MTTAGIDLSEHSVVSVFTKYLFVNAVIDLVALSIEAAYSSSDMPSILLIIKDDAVVDLGVGGATGVVKASVADT